VDKSKTTVKNILLFIVLVIIVRVWLRFDQDFLPEKLLTPVFALLVMVLLHLFYSIVRPADVMSFSLKLALAILVTTITLSLVQHLLIARDFADSWQKSLIIWSVAFAAPLLSGYLYNRRKR